LIRQNTSSNYEMNGMKNKLLALDSNIFIYHFEENPLFTTQTSAIFTLFIKGFSRGITNIISIIEVLSYPAPKNLLREREEDFKTLPNFTIYEINHEIAVEAARIRRAYGIRLPDAIQLATALLGKADIFITNDTKLQNFKDIKVVLLTDIKNI